MASLSVKIQREARRRRCLILLIAVVSLTFLAVYFLGKFSAQSDCRNEFSQRLSHSYNRSSPLVFIGGFPHSGGVLVRNILNVHPDIRCGSDSVTIPKMLKSLAGWKKSSHEWARLTMAGVTDSVTSDAIAAFIIEILFGRHSEPKHLCNEEPFSVKNGLVLSNLFPHAKFILVIRDGRAVIHSLLKERITVEGLNFTDYKVGLTEWSLSIQGMIEQCKLLGNQRCLRVRYEDLVLGPRSQLEMISAHLELSNLENVVAANSNFASITAKLQPSLTQWVGSIPVELVEKMHTILPVLDELGYDARANPPNYGISNSGPEIN